MVASLEYLDESEDDIADNPQASGVPLDLILLNLANNNEENIYPVIPEPHQKESRNTKDGENETKTNTFIPLAVN